MPKIKVHIKAEVILFYDHEIEIEKDIADNLKFNPMAKDSEKEPLLLKYCKGKIPSDYILNDVSVIPVALETPYIKKEKSKEKTIEPVDKNHFKYMQSRAKRRSLRLEIKEGYIALTHGFKGSKQIKTWGNKDFNTLTIEELIVFLKKYS